jgi:hypothetical protein
MIVNYTFDNQNSGLPQIENITCPVNTAKLLAMERHLIYWS